VKRKQDEPSAARLAAEALFLPQPATSAPGDPGVVVVRKKRVFIDERPATDVPPSTAEVVHAERRPRVFRIESAVLAVGMGSNAGVSGGSPADQEPQAVEGVRRSQRKAAPVVITRPQEALRSAQQRLAGEPGSSPVDKAEVGTAERQSGFTLESFRYPRLSAELARLRELAESLERQEAEQALRWVQEMVQRYDLRPRDIGL
jgi:hypothetical protein